MPPAPDPSSRPIDVYKMLIDTLVDEASNSIHARWVVGDGYFSHAPEDEMLNRFAASLSPEQRGLLAEMLREERFGAIHDVLALLSWLIQCHGVALTFRGEPMPANLLDGPGLHGDYVGRREGEDWPAE